MNEIISFTIKNSLKRKLDRFRGDIPRSRFIVRLLESYFNNKENRNDPIDKNRFENINPTDDIFHVE